jgi:hypothetical protein
LCDAAGVGNFGSGGREEVNVHDFGRSAIEVPEYEVLFDIWAAIWASRMRGIEGRRESLESIYNEEAKFLGIYSKYKFKVKEAFRRCL